MGCKKQPNYQQRLWIFFNCEIFTSYWPQNSSVVWVPLELWFCVLEVKYCQNQGHVGRQSIFICKGKINFFLIFSLKQAFRYLLQQYQIKRMLHQNNICLSQSREQFRKVILRFSSLGSGRARDGSKDVLWLQCSRLTQELRGYKVKSHKL